MQKLLLLILLPLLFCCKSKKTQLTDEDDVNVEDFIEFFPEVKTSYVLPDSALNVLKSDSSLISFKIFTQFVPDSLIQKQFGKTAKPKIFPLGRVNAKTDETYLFVRLSQGVKKVIYVLAFNKNHQYIAGMPLLISDSDPKTSVMANMDSRYSITSLQQRRKDDGQVLYKKNVYILNADAGGFALILTESNDTEMATNTVINPIDTTSRKHKFSGDYIQDKKNFISIRDGKNPSTLLFFIHFEKDNGNCKGELKGEANIAGTNIARYIERGNPCALDFVFSGRNVSMKEKGGCGSHRDIKCFFEGTYTRKSTPAPKKNTATKK